jgi:hypothetical protein
MGGGSPAHAECLTSSSKGLSPTGIRSSSHLSFASSFCFGDLKIVLRHSMYHWNRSLNTGVNTRTDIYTRQSER